MKKTLFAGALLLALLAASFWNVRCIDRLTDTVTLLAETAREKADEDAASARLALEEAFRLWESAAGYTNVFIRHSEIDAVADAFYDAFAVLDGESTRGEVQSAFDRLEKHLACIDAMEHVTVKSVF